MFNVQQSMFNEIQLHLGIQSGHKQQNSVLLYLPMPKVTINGQIYEAAKGQTIIQVADDVGVQIPRYCYHPDIGIEGSCRMCLVEVEKSPKLVPSRATPIGDG